MPKKATTKSKAKHPVTQKEVEAEEARRAKMTPEERLEEDTADVKNYDEKVSDYKEHFDNLGMHDPGTEARIQAMETAPERFDITADDGREPELVERDKARAAHAEELQSGVTGTTGKFGAIPAERKAMNEKLSETLTDRKEHDEKEQELQEKGLKANIDRGGSEEAVEGFRGKKIVKK